MITEQQAQIIGKTIVTVTMFYIGYRLFNKKKETKLSKKFKEFKNKFFKNDYIDIKK